jgi:hypothetical protein
MPMDNTIAYQGKMVPDLYHLTKGEYELPIRSKPIPDDRSLYISSLAVLNGIQRIALLSFFNNSEYERGLIHTLNVNGIKAINLMKNLWVIYRDDIYEQNAMYILSLFIPNAVEEEVAQQIRHTFKYLNYGVNSYDYINGILIGYPIDKIRDQMFHEYDVWAANDSNSSIFDLPTDKQVDDSDAILFDAIFNFISSECNKMLHYVFNESTIFSEFVKTNRGRICRIPEFRLKVDVPRIALPKIINLLEPPKVIQQCRGKKGKRGRKRIPRINILTQLGYVSK